MPQRVTVFARREPAPIQRGQGNLPYRSEEKNRVLARGQDTPYDLNGAPTGGTLADGDYGDIVVSSSGATMEFDPTVVTAFARTILDDADAAAVRATIDAAPTSHAHVIADVTGLQAELDAKLTASKVAAQADSTAPDVATLVTDFNALLAKLRAAGVQLT